MTIFQLALFVCTTLQPTGLADRYSRECDWRPQGFYVLETKCNAEGTQQHGDPVHQFSRVIGAKVAVENHRCAPIWLIQ